MSITLALQLKGACRRALAQPALMAPKWHRRPKVEGSLCNMTGKSVPTCCNVLLILVGGDRCERAYHGIPEQSSVAEAQSWPQGGGTGPPVRLTDVNAV